MTKLIVSNLHQFLNVAQRNPALLAIPAFRSISPLLESIHNINKSGGCKCQIGPLLEAYKPRFKAALTMLQPADALVIKSILKVQQFCYYDENNGKRTLKCL